MTGDVSAESLHLPEGSCPFCRIIRGESRAEILYESSEGLAFLDINPINFGHALVVTKRHFKDFSELPVEVLHDVVNVLQIVSKAIVESVHPAGFNIFNNNGLAAGQSVFHFHFHVAPRYNDDGLKVKPQLKTYESPDQMAEYAKKIRAKMQI
ncbi:MAG: HIT domain-containing protein [Candidatus Kryptoniota bacterium]